MAQDVTGADPTTPEARAAALHFAMTLGDVLGDEVEGWVIRSDADEDEPGVLPRAVAFRDLGLLDEECDEWWDVAEPAFEDETVWRALQALTPFTPFDAGLAWGSVHLIDGARIPTQEEEEEEEATDSSGDPPTATP